jgi:hypothetical protein
MFPAEYLTVRIQHSGSRVVIVKRSLSSVPIALTSGVQRRLRVGFSSPILACQKPPEYCLPGHEPEAAFYRSTLGASTCTSCPPYVSSDDLAVRLLAYVDVGVLTQMTVMP